GPAALEPARGRDGVTLLRIGEREQEAAEQERALGLAERALVGPEAIRIPVLCQLARVCLDRRNRSRIVGGDRSTARRQEQRGIEPLVARGALPASSGAAPALRCRRGSRRRARAGAWPPPGRDGERSARAGPRRR